MDKNIKDRRRQHYKCNIGTCNARYWEDYTGSKRTKIIIISRGFNEFAHNHFPPTNPKTSPDVKKQCLDYLSVGVTPAVVHKQCVNASKSMSPIDVPSVSQLTTWKYRASMEDMPSGKHLCSHSLGKSLC